MMYQIVCSESKQNARRNPNTQRHDKHYQVVVHHVHHRLYYGSESSMHLYIKIVKLNILDSLLLSRILFGAGTET